MWEIWENYFLPKGLKALPKVQLIAQSGHTARVKHFITIILDENVS